MSVIQRYDLDLEQTGLVDSQGGELVYYSDHQAAVASLTAELAQARETIERLQQRVAELEGR